MNQPAAISQQAATPAPAASAPAGGVAGASVTSAPAAATPSSATPAAAGGVKGAVVALHPTKAKPSGGVLGTATRLGGTIASSHLPFTGLPLWIFAGVALALVLIGTAARRFATGRI